jgi:hypothetical protein
VPPDFNEKRYSFPPKGRIAFTFFVKDYSTDIAVAWEVVERMRSDDWLVSLWTDEGQWCVEAYKPVYVGYAKEDTAPEAICLAALKVMGGRT